MGGGRSLAVGAAVVAVVAALTTPTTTARAQEHDATEPAWGLVITGASIFLTSYGFSIAMAASDPVDGIAAVPLVGPWIALESLSSDEGLFKFSLGLWGAFQAVGVVLGTLGLLTRRRRPPSRVALSPYLSPDGGGVVVGGRL